MNKIYGGYKNIGEGFGSPFERRISRPREKDSIGGCQERKIFNDSIKSVFQEFNRYKGNGNITIPSSMIELKKIAVSQIEWCLGSGCMRFNITGDEEHPVYACWVLNGDKRIISLKDGGGLCCYLSNQRTIVPKNFGSVHKDNTAYICNFGK